MTAPIEPALTPTPDDLVETFSRLVHEVKTPLAALRSLAQGLGFEPAIMADPAAREIASQYTGRMVQEVDRLVRLVDSFKAMSKPRHTPNPHAELRELIASRLHDAFAHRATQQGLRFRLRVPKEVYVRAESDEIFQVLTNLVTNAFRATPTGGQVTVTGDDTGDLACVTVEDTGPGLSDEALIALQAGEPVPNPSGSGIGLLVVRAIIRRQGGEIAFERPLDGGTRVILTWPLDDSVPTALEGAA